MGRRALSCEERIAAKEKYKEQRRAKYKQRILNEDYRTKVREAMRKRRADPMFREHDNQLRRKSREKKRSSIDSDGAQTTTSSNIKPFVILSYIPQNSNILIPMEITKINKVQNCNNNIHIPTTVQINNNHSSLYPSKNQTVNNNSILYSTFKYEAENKHSNLYSTCNSLAEVELNNYENHSSWTKEKSRLFETISDESIHYCYCCNRLWFMNSLRKFFKKDVIFKDFTEEQMKFIFSVDDVDFGYFCYSCIASSCKGNNLALQIMGFLYFYSH